MRRRTLSLSIRATTTMPEEELSRRVDSLAPSTIEPSAKKSCQLELTSSAHWARYQEASVT
jgi:hypothetical protein